MNKFNDQFDSVLEKLEGLAHFSLFIIILEFLVIAIRHIVQSPQDWNRYVGLVWMVLVFIIWCGDLQVFKLSKKEIERRRIRDKRLRIMPNVCSQCHHYTLESLTDQNGHQIICRLHPSGVENNFCRDCESTDEFYQRERIEKIPLPCRGCQNYHGIKYRIDSLNCAIHPYGIEGDSCPDYSPERSLKTTQH